MSIPLFFTWYRWFPRGKANIHFLWSDFFFHLLFVSIVATELDTQSLLNDNVVTRTCDAVEYPVIHAQNTESTYQ